MNKSCGCGEPGTTPTVSWHCFPSLITGDHFFQEFRTESFCHFTSIQLGIGTALLTMDLKQFYTYAFRFLMNKPKLTVTKKELLKKEEDPASGTHPLLGEGRLRGGGGRGLIILQEYKNKVKCFELDFFFVLARA